MNISKHIILIPVYNDWKSLNKLLYQLDQISKNNDKTITEVLVINDASTDKLDIDKNRLMSLEKITIITLNKNLGTQKAIAIGLLYLKDKGNDIFVTVMDGDGEDDPFQIENMLQEAKKSQNIIITSNRTKRKEPMIFKFLYKIHLLITLIFSFNWISFGNFTTFNSKNIPKILSNNNSWYAHASSVLNNCNIKRVYAPRKKRYFDQSKMNLLTLIEHSLRVNAVFFPKIILSSLIYALIIFFVLDIYYLNYILIFLILIFDIVVFSVKRKHFIKNLVNVDSFIDKIKLL